MVGPGVGAGFANSGAPAWWLGGGLTLLGSGPIWMGTQESMTGLVGGTSELWRSVIPGTVDMVASGAGRPTRTATGLDLDGAANFMTAAGLTSASTDYTACFVVEPDDTAGTQTLLGCNTNESFSHAVAGSVSLHDGTAARTGMVSTARLQMLTYVVKAAGTLWEVYRDGVLLATGATYDGTWSWGATPVLGAAFGGLAGFFDGEIRFACVYASALSAGNLSTLHSVVANRFGIAYSPLSHAIDGWWSMYAGYLTLSGSDVQQLTDRSGLGHHLVKPAGANRPAWNAAEGTIDFDAANTEALQCPSAGWSRVQPCTLIGDVLAGGTTNDTVWDGTAGNSGRLYVNGSDQFVAYSGAVLTHATSVTTNWNRVRATYNSPGGAVTSAISVNGGAATTGNAGTANPGGLTLGAFGSLLAWGAPRYRRHLISLPYVPTAEELAALDAYLAGAA